MTLKDAICLIVEVENMPIMIWVKNREMSLWITGNVAGLQSGDNLL